VTLVELLVALAVVAVLSTAVHARSMA